MDTKRKLIENNILARSGFDSGEVPGGMIDLIIEGNEQEFIETVDRLYERHGVPNPCMDGMLYK